MKQKLLQSGLVLAVLVTAFLSWFFVSRAILVPEASHWLAPIVWVSVFAIFLCLSAILLKEKWMIAPVIAISFFFSLFFAFSLWHFLILIVSSLFAIWGANRMRRDLGMNVKINLWKSLLRGKVQIILAVALVISSQYFFTIKNMDGQRVMPQFDINGSIVKFAIPMLSAVNPDFKSMNQDGLTVDQYLMKAQQDNVEKENAVTMDDESIESQIPEDVPVKQRELLKQDLLKKVSETQNQLSQNNKELILAGLRKQFSQAMGQDLKGNEKMTDVLAGVVSKKMNEIIEPNVNGSSISSMLPLIFSLVLFFTIVPLSSWILSILWFFLVILLFKLLVKFGFVEIKTEMVEKESIQY